MHEVIKITSFMSPSLTLLALVIEEAAVGNLFSSRLKMEKVFFFSFSFCLNSSFVFILSNRKSFSFCEL